MAEEQPQDSADGTPKLFKSMTGVIAGLTALVVALGGLFTAYDKFIRKEPEKVETAATATPAAAASMPQTAPPSREKVRKSYTTGDGGTLQWVSGMWVWTDGKDNTYRYTEESNDGVTIIAKLRENGENVWLQWPTEGGDALQSFDEQEHWEKPIKVTVKKPAATES
jgi:hypothetical protein